MRIFQKYILNDCVFIKTYHRNVFEFPTIISHRQILPPRWAHGKTISTCQRSLSLALSLGRVARWHTFTLSLSSIEQCAKFILCCVSQDDGPSTSNDVCCFWSQYSPFKVVTFFCCVLCIDFAVCQRDHCTGSLDQGLKFWKKIKYFNF